MPEIGLERDRFWQLQNEKVSKIGGVGPRPLPPLRAPISLPRFVHVHMDTGWEDRDWEMPLAVSAKDAVAINRDGCPLSLSHLATRRLLALPNKILMISARDPWLQKFYRGLGREFFDSLDRVNFSAIICPNLSAYHHVEHRVWLDNRALIQRFMEKLLERGLPGIFYTYLEDSALHKKWLTEYFQLNASQQFVATGFDRMSRGKFFNRRMTLLAEIEQAIGRPLRVVLNCVVSRLKEISFASILFPGRVHLMGQSLFHKSAKGKILSVGENGKPKWLDGGGRLRPGLELFRYNAKILEDAVAAAAPDFFGVPAT